MLARLCQIVEDYCKRHDSYKMIKRGSDEVEYLGRSFLVRIPKRFGAYLHQIHVSDEDLHDHPWDNISIVLSGGYWETTVDFSALGKASGWSRVWRGPGAIIRRKAEDTHCLVMQDGQKESTWSLFIHLRRRRAWGFWKLDPDDSNQATWTKPPQNPHSSLKGFLFPKIQGNNYD